MGSPSLASPSCELSWLAQPGPAAWNVDREGPWNLGAPFSFSSGSASCLLFLGFFASGAGTVPSDVQASFLRPRGAAERMLEPVWWAGVCGVGTCAVCVVTVALGPGQ